MRMRSTLRTHKCLLSAAIAIAIFTFIYFNMTTLKDRCVHSEPVPGSRIVLYWTEVWGRDAVSLVGGRDTHRCSPNCVITTNRCSLTSADAVVFHFRDASLFDVPHKIKGQKWIFYISESPESTRLYPSIFLRVMNQKIDSFLSYRQDSQIYVPYARVVKRPTEVAWTPVKLKPIKVAWFVSNCKTSSRREDLVKELSKHIQVDIFGDCGSLSCPRSNDSCNKMLDDSYSFYMSLENSLCKDYVTEKLFRTLQHNVIPIVLGPSDNFSILPNGSFIDAGKFKSVANLAAYLNAVASNEKVFNSFLEWKSKYEIQEPGYIGTFCAPCDQQSDVQRPESWTDWWFNDAHCYSWAKE